jgi:hypothetical protein
MEVSRLRSTVKYLKFTLINQFEFIKIFGEHFKQLAHSLDAICIDLFIVEINWSKIQTL